VLVTISSMSVPICNHFHVRRANSGRITPFKLSALLSPFCSRVPLKPSGVKFCHEILESLRYHMAKTRSLYLSWSCNCTGTWHQDRHQDRITVANTRVNIRRWRLIWRPLGCFLGLTWLSLNRRGFALSPNVREIAWDEYEKKSKGKRERRKMGVVPDGQTPQPARKWHLMLNGFLHYVYRVFQKRIPSFIFGITSVIQHRS